MKMKWSKPRLIHRWLGGAPFLCPTCEENMLCISADVHEYIALDSTAKSISITWLGRNAEPWGRHCYSLAARSRFKGHPECDECLLHGFIHAH